MKATTHLVISIVVHIATHLAVATGHAWIAIAIASCAFVYDYTKTVEGAGN